MRTTPGRPNKGKAGERERSKEEFLLPPDIKEAVKRGNSWILESHVTAQKTALCFTMYLTCPVAAAEPPAENSADSGFPNSSRSFPLS